MIKLFAAILFILSCFIQGNTQVYHTEYEKGKLLDSFYVRNYFHTNDYKHLDSVLKKEYSRTKDEELIIYSQLLKRFSLLDDKKELMRLQNDAENKFNKYPNTEARVYYVLAFHYFWNIAEYELAFEMFLKLETQLEKYGYKIISDYTVYYNMMGEAYYKFRDYRKAINCYELSLKNPLFTENKWAIYNNLGLCFKELNKLDSSTHYLHKAVSSVSRNAATLTWSISLGNIGYNYYLQKKYDEAKPLIKLDYDRALIFSEYPLAIGAAIPLADIYILEKKYALADSQLYNARKWISITKQYNRLAKYFPVKSNYYAALGNYKLAAQFKDSAINAISYNDSVYNTLLVLRANQRNNLKILANETAEFNSYKKINNTRIIAVVIISFILIIAFILFGKYRRKVKTDKQKIEELNRMLELRQRISADMHDEIGSTLSGISLYTHSLFIKAEESEQKTILKKINDSTTDIQEKMSDIIWNINPKMDNIDELLIRMRSFGADITAPLNINFNLYASNNLMHIHTDIIMRKNVYLIYKEAINNAVKYSKCKNLTVSLNIENNILQIGITDDGVGFDISLPKHGNGLNNMVKRASEMNAEFDINSVLSSGTTITLSVPV